MVQEYVLDDPVPTKHIHTLRRGKWVLDPVARTMTQSCTVCNTSLVYMEPLRDVVESNNPNKKVYWYYIS
jgi:hypothetical protein